MGETALLSVYRKEGIVKFARELRELGWNILASGGTAQVLSDAGVPVQDVADLVGGGAIFGHRVVTLSREIHAGILARDTEEDRAELKQLGIPWIDLVCVDLYPLEEETAREGSTRESVVEKTDVGGPTLLHSAAKGWRIVICDPRDRQEVIGWLRDGQPDEDDFVTALVAKAEATVAKCCLASARYHSDGDRDGVVGRRVGALRYGENPWQKSARHFTAGTDDPRALERFQLVEGGFLSLVNATDVDRMLQTVTHIAAAWDLNYGVVPSIAVGVKHGNPCGAAVGDDPIRVLRKMLTGEPQAIFGGYVFTNFKVGPQEANTLLHYESDKRRILDGVVAQRFTPKAIEALRRKGDRCRMLTNPALADLGIESLDRAPRFRYVRGGFLVQPNYDFVLSLKDQRLERFGEVTPVQETDLLLAWALCATSNSNTITLVRDGQLIGSGVGQKSRVRAAGLAIDEARDSGHDLNGASAASDSFFPFTDGLEVLAEAGVTAILATSGSIRDGDIRAFCAENGVTLCLIPDEVARGFYCH